LWDKKTRLFEKHLKCPPFLGVFNLVFGVIEDVVHVLKG